MEIIQYIATDWFTHYILTPAYNMPFLLWLFMVIAGGELIYIILKKIAW